MTVNTKAQNAIFVLSIVGHLEKMCFRKKAGEKQQHSYKHSGSQKVHATTIQHEVADEVIFSVHNTAGQKTPPPISCTVNIQDTPVTFELDTGASCTIMNTRTYGQLKANLPPLTTDNTRLLTFTGAALKVIGRLDVRVTHEEKNMTLPLYVVEGPGPNLLGRL